MSPSFAEEMEDSSRTAGYGGRKQGARHENVVIGLLLYALTRGLFGPPRRLAWLAKGDVVLMATSRTKLGRHWTTAPQSLQLESQGIAVAVSALRLMGDQAMKKSVTCEANIRRPVTEPVIEGDIVAQQSCGGATTYTRIWPRDAQRFDTGSTHHTKFMPR